MEDFKIICWLWNKEENQPWRKGTYKPEHVVALKNMFAQHLQIPHQLICITDSPNTFPPEIETYPLWKEPIVETQRNRPNCYKRLKMFSDWAHNEFGPEFLSIDLDVLVLSDITSLIEKAKEVEFKIAKGSAATYNGSIWYHKTGTRTELWDEFDPESSPALARTVKNKKGKPLFGSDQAWISYRFPEEKTWSKKDGVYHYMKDLHRKNRGRNFKLGELDYEAKIILFAGANCKPWTPWMRTLNPLIHKEYQKFL